MRNKPLLAVVGLLLLAAAPGCKPDADVARFKRVKEKLGSDKENDRAIGAELARTVTHPKHITKLVPILIERLDPTKEKNPWTSLYAASSLAIITGQDFGSQRRSHKRWHEWWFKKVKQKLPKVREPDKEHISRLNAQRLNQQGELHLAGGNTVKAMDFFRQAISRDGRRALYHSNLGLALLKMGHHDGASQRFDDAIAVDPGFILAYLNKGAVYSDQARKLRAVAARIQLAINAFDRVDDKKRLQAARKELARTTKLIQDSDEKALDTYRHAVAVDRGDRLWAAHAAMGRVYMQRGNFEKAVGPLEKANRMRRNDLGIHRDLALTYYGLDQYYRASKQIKRVEELGGKMDPGFTKKVEDKVKDMEKSLRS
jgi:tetratricopeptide (TPR) repeat protein